MAYLVLARKWRPQTFEDVVGQSHVTKTLRNAVRSGRIAHAYLFTGARGVGKTSVARILAKTLNCEQEPGSRPCNVCSNCREITQGSAVDVLEIDGASNRGIDSIRELRETVRYRPAKSRHKIYIIDEVHMLTPEAFNALLKTLEEPPEQVLFVFATTEPHKIPQTILSRCQRFDFRRLTIAELVQHLRRIVESESGSFSDAVLFAVAREADGSMRDAQSLLEQLMAFSSEDLSDEEILDVLGVVDRRSVLKTADAILSGNARACMEVVEDLYRRGIDSRRFCQQLCDHFRNLLFVALGGVDGAGRLEVPAEEIHSFPFHESRPALSGLPDRFERRGGHSPLESASHQPGDALASTVTVAQAGEPRPGPGATERPGARSGGGRPDHSGPRVRPGGPGGGEVLAGRAVNGAPGPPARRRSSVAGGCGWVGRGEHGRG